MSLRSWRLSPLPPNALFGHSAATNLAILGLIVGLVIAGIPSRWAIPGLVIVGLLLAGLSHHLTGYLVTLKIAGWVSGGLVALGVVALVVWQLPGFLESFKPRTRAGREQTLLEWRQYHQARQERADQARLDTERRNAESKKAASRSQAGLKERQAYYRQYQRAVRELSMSDWRRFVGGRDLPAADDVVVFWPDPGGRTARNKVGRVIQPVDPTQRFTTPFVAGPRGRTARNFYGQVIEFTDAMPLPCNTGRFATPDEIATNFDVHARCAAAPAKADIRSYLGWSHRSQR